jgi:DHA1 family solute carrier family 18 vesicular amine transporter 1/2
LPKPEWPTVSAQVHKANIRVPNSLRVQVPLTALQRTSLLNLTIFIFALMFAIGVSTPIVPLYASSLGASWTEIGLLGTGWGITLMLLGGVSGNLSDRWGRKPLLVGSGLLSVVAAVLYIASSTVLQVILIRILEGTAWAFFWPTVEALATEIAEPKLAGRAMGIATASYGVAFATSSFVGGYITSAFGYNGTFYTYLLLSLISSTIAILLVRGSKPVKVASSVSKERRKLDSASLRSPTILLAYFLGGAYTFGFGIIASLFSVYAKTLGVAVFLIGALFGCFWFGRLLGAFVGGLGSDKIGRGLVVIVAMGISTVGFILLAFSTGIELLFAGIIALGLSIGAIFPTVVALISDNVRQSVRGFAMGIFESTCAAGYMLAAALGGLLSDLISPRAPYLLAATISLASVIIFSIRRVK